MEDVFENRIIINAGNNDNLFHLIEEELSVVPLRLIRLVFDKGFKLYYVSSCANDPKSFFIKHGLHYDDELSYKKKLEEYGGLMPSHIQYDKKAIILTENEFLKTGHPHSVVVHEFGHAIDDALDDLHKHMPRGEPLDFYAASKISEKFAVAFEAFCHLERFCGNDYRIHNKLELSKKAPDIFKFFDQLFREWEDEALL